MIPKMKNITCTVENLCTVGRALYLCRTTFGLSIVLSQIVFYMMVLNTSSSATTLFIAVSLAFVHTVWQLKVNKLVFNNL